MSISLSGVTFRISFFSRLARKSKLSSLSVKTSFSFFCQTTSRDGHSRGYYSRGVSRATVPSKRECPQRSTPQGSWMVWQGRSGSGKIETANTYLKVNNKHKASLHKGCIRVVGCLGLVVAAKWFVMGIMRTFSQTKRIILGGSSRLLSPNSSKERRRNKRKPKSFRFQRDNCWSNVRNCDDQRILTLYLLGVIGT